MGIVRYRRAPSSSTEERVEAVGLAADVFALIPPDGVYAAPTDVYGCTAQYSTTYEWVGCLGIFLSLAAFNVLPTAALGTGAWALVNVDNNVMVMYTWSGSSWASPSTLAVRNTTTNTILPADVCIRYTGNTNITFSLPVATGSDRVIKFLHAGAASAQMNISTVANGGQINGDTLVVVTKGSDGTVVPVEILDAAVATWSISG